MLAQSLCHSPPTSAFWRPWSPLSNEKSWVPFAWATGMRHGQEGEKYWAASAGMGTQKKCKVRGSIPVSDGEEAQGGEAPSCPLLLWPLGLQATQDELGCRLFCLEQRNRHTFREEQDLSGKRKSHKEICLPPCKMAALKHLSGSDGGPSQRTQGCPGSVQSPELCGWGKQPLESPQPLACSTWPAP